MRGPLVYFVTIWFNKDHCQKLPVIALHVLINSIKQKKKD